MKRLDMKGKCVVYAGEDWRHGLPPCSKEMMRHLERNEKIVSWLQPVDGRVEDQIPAIRVNDAFYSMSLRMMKAIWRHVRLRKGFDNVERSPYGGMKLKIPTSLLAEKLRTQSRFNVSLMLVFWLISCNQVQYYTPNVLIFNCNVFGFDNKDNLIVSFVCYFKIFSRKFIVVR
jgi:hypothetical protein